LEEIPALVPAQMTRDRIAQGHSEDELKVPAQMAEGNSQQSESQLWQES
jgi:hypothetical protein